MEVETIDASVEDRILIAMVTDPVVLAKLVPYWKEDRPELSSHINSTGPLICHWTNRIASWCVKHFHKRGSVPRAGIRSYFERWAAKHSSQADIDEIERILLRLGDSFENGVEIDASQLIEEAIEHLNYVKIRNLNKVLSSDINARDTQKALTRISSFIEVGLTEDENEDFLSNDEAVESLFSGSDLEALINFSSPLGGVAPGRQGLRDFFQDSLCRDGFIAIQGSEKSGKSYILQELAIQAMIERKRVAFFEVGDMSKKQIGFRIYTRISEHPLRSPGNTWPYEISIPAGLKVDFKKAIDERARITKHRKVTFAAPLDLQTAKKARQSFIKRQVGSKENSYLKLVVKPNMTVTVDDIQAQIRTWQLTGWMPDVVVIDYCDILADPTGRFDKKRDMINATWAQLRRLSEENHCLVLTATQADSDSYQVIAQTKKNFSEDKRKNAHVTGILGLNISPLEKARGIMRLNWLFSRDLPFSEKDFCYLANCLSLANPFVQSSFPSIAKYRNEEI